MAMHGALLRWTHRVTGASKLLAAGLQQRQTGHRRKRSLQVLQLIGFLAEPPPTFEIVSSNSHSRV